jgi:GT2 family glycosyltransferase
MSTLPKPLVSVVILSHNSGRFLRSCLTSVFKSHYPNFEVILVDNGSTDVSIDSVRNEFGNRAGFRVVETRVNLGASAGRNIGTKCAHGKYLAFLDSDTQVDDNWLAEAVATMESVSSVGAIQCKLMLMPNKNQLDYVGDFLSQFGFLVQRVPMGTPDGTMSQKRAQIFAVKSAGMVIRKELFEKVGMFDEDFFIYMEETDLCWRIWLNGYEVLYEPKSIVYHSFPEHSKLVARNTAFLAKYHGTKNYVTTILKDSGSVGLVKILPIHMFCWIGIGVWHHAHGRFEEGRWIFRALIYNVVNLKLIWRKRLTTQHLVRHVADKTIMPRIMTRISPTYLIRKITDPNSGWRI